jgi:uncharacterized protein (DUF2267 family)
VRSVFRVIIHRLDPGQVQHVREALPQPLQTLWPDTTRHAAA